MKTSRPPLSTTSVALGIAGVLWISQAGAQAAPPDEFWPDLKRDFFQNREIAESPKFVALDAPIQAEDAALVPVKMAIHTPPDDPRRVVKMSLLIDENPVPLAGTFTLGPRGDVVQIATRVRVNANTYIHLVAELSDGSLTEAKRYIRAAGGCSAPAAKAAGDAEFGRLKFRMLPDIVHGRREAVVMIRHPNFTGMQMDESTHDYTPARYVDHFAVYQGEDLVFAVDGGISISEDPNFRFAFGADPNRDLKVDARDISGGNFTATWPITASGG